LRKTLAFMAASMAVLITTTGAHASGSATQGLQDLRELNLIVLKDMSGGHDVEGKTFVGGRLTNAATYGIGRSNQGFLASSFPTLTVGGNAGGNLNINNGPNGPVANGVTPEGAVIGGNAGTVSINGAPASLIVGGSVGNFNPNGDAYQHDVGPSVGAAIAAQTASFVADLSALSNALAALPVTAGSGYNDSDPNNATFTAVDGGHGYAVIAITNGQAAFQGANNFVYNIPKVGSGYLPTIINVSGSTSYVLNANSNLSAYNPYVIWNFVGATSITLGRQFNGSLLAPMATVSNSTPIEGSVAVKAFNQGGEVHLGTFAGSPGLTQSFTAGVPEPTGWALMLVGLGGMGLAIRSRRRQDMAA
jgi:choice-of-anchor A domain-containing protein